MGADVSDASDHEIPAEELRARVIYALFLPAVRLARAFEVDLGELRGWLEVAYFHDMRCEDLKMREIAEVMGVSMSKVSLLSRQLKASFVRPEIEAELPRRIEFMLWAEPLSSAKIKQVLTDVPGAQVDRALRQLHEQGRLRRVEQGTVIAHALDVTTDRRVWEDWVARIDGLQDILGGLANVVFGRFFRGEPRALARTLTFRVERQALEQLRQLYEQVVFPRVVELDAQAEQAASADVEEISLSLFWAPVDYIQRALAAGAAPDAQDETPAAPTPTTPDEESE